MINNIKPYPAYKDSGIPGLDKVPEHWDVMRLKYICRLAYGDSLPSDLRIKGEIPVYGSNGPVGFHSSANTLAPVIIIGRKGSFGKVKFSSEPVFAIDTTFFIDQRFTDANLTWLSYALTILGLDEVTKDSAVPGLDREDAYQRFLMYPPLSEQRAIVRFLNWAERRIRKAIRLRQKRIKLLEEYKQALIHQAVTGQIDVRTGQPYPEYKDSGVEWLGKVPAHWEIRSLRYLATKFGSGITPRGGSTVYQKEGIPLLRSQNIHFSGLILKNVARISKEIHLKLSATHVRPKDVLLNITGASIGRVCAVPDDFKEGNVNQHVCIIRPKSSLLSSEFLASYLSTPFMQQEIRFEQNGASREGLTLQAIRNFKIIFPSVSEQKSIVLYLKDINLKIDATISADRKAIELLKEFRTTLIAEVVTGKLDVREAAAQLPEEPEAEEEELAVPEPEESSEARPQETFVEEVEDE